MAKKPQGTAPPNPHNVPNRDIMQRLNFLYQAGTYLSSLSAIKGGATPTTRPGEQTGELPLATPAYLSRAYINSMKTIGRKTVVKLDPSVKRTICKGCNALLIPGVTATTRSRSSSSHKKLVGASCLNCNTTRRIPAPPLLQDDSDPPQDPESSMQVDGTGAGGKKRKRPRKVVYKQSFFERPEHMLFRGNQMIVRTEDLPSHGTTESVRMETGAGSTWIG